MKVVSNSTPLIALSRINKLEILHEIFHNIIIPQAVYQEVVLDAQSVQVRKRLKMLPG